MAAFTAAFSCGSGFVQDGLGGLLFGTLHGGIELSALGGGVGCGVGVATSTGAG
jgi:hypothetical protein